MAGITTSSSTRSMSRRSLASPSMPSRAGSASCPSARTSAAVIFRVTSSSSMTRTRLRRTVAESIMRAACYRSCSGPVSLLTGMAR